MLNINNPPTFKAFKNQSGFTLIEVLITVFVLGVGLLGIAGLQATSLKLSHDSHLRSQASILAYDIIDKMRVNPNPVTPYSGSFTGLNNASTACLNNVNTCNAEQLRNFDLQNWQNRLNNAFPGARATIVINNNVAGQRVATVSIIWVDTDNEGGNDNQINAANAFRTFVLTAII
ncbi:MAG: type IV pilus modification protein PilV [Arenicella sp.]